MKKNKIRCPNGHVVKIKGQPGEKHFRCGVCGVKGKISRLP